MLDQKNLQMANQKKKHEHDESDDESQHHKKKESKKQKPKEIKNFMSLNIICPDDESKTIPKFILQKIVPEEQNPLNIIKEENELLNYLRIYAKKYIQKFQHIYTDSQRFKLSKYGQYCGVGLNCYTLFSQNILAYLELGKKGWEGFCYCSGYSTYIGQMAEMKSNGEGKCLYRYQHVNKKNNQIKVLFHQFIGQWKQGEFTKGSRKSYQHYQLHAKPFMQYIGQFSKFIFHGIGKLKTRQNTLKGKFDKGKHIAKEPPKQNKKEEQKQDLQFISNRKTVAADTNKPKKLQGLKYINLRKQQIKTNEKQQSNNSIPQQKEEQRKENINNQLNSQLPKGDDNQQII